MDGYGAFNFLDVETDNILSQIDLESILTQDLVKVEHFNEILQCLPQEEVPLNNLTEDYAANARFSKPLSNTEFEQSLKERIPKRTIHANNWSLSAYHSWRTWRQFRSDTRADPNWPIPDLCGPVEGLSYWLARFIYEVRRQDGTPYPPDTLNNIAAGLQRYMRETLKRTDVHLFKKDDSYFITFRNSLDKRRKELLASGVGTRKKSAHPVSVCDEAILWDKDVFNADTAQGLSYTVYFYNCKVFGFRAMDEHVNLCTDQFQFGSDEKGHKYVDFEGRLSKNVSGAVDSKGKPKFIRQFADQSNPRCIVSILEKYIGLVEPGRFYRRPLPNRKNMVVFSLQCVGVNTLSKYMCRMFEQAGIDFKSENRNISNHSGKVTCCTRLWNKGFDEQSITSRSGHRSTAARAYKRPSTEQLKGLSNALQPPAPLNHISVPNQDKTPATSTYTPGQSKPPTNDNQRDKENMQLEDSDNILTITVPNSINKVVIKKNGKRFALEL